jgi:hypothetical protein
MNIDTPFSSLWNQDESPFYPGITEDHFFELEYFDNDVSKLPPLFELDVELKNLDNPTEFQETSQYVSANKRKRGSTSSTYVEGRESESDQNNDDSIQPELTCRMPTWSQSIIDIISQFETKNDQNKRKRTSELQLPLTSTTHLEESSLYGDEILVLDEEQRSSNLEDSIVQTQASRIFWSSADSQLSITSTAHLKESSPYRDEILILDKEQESSNLDDSTIQTKARIFWPTEDARKLLRFLIQNNEWKKLTTEVWNKFIETLSEKMTPQQCRNKVSSFLYNGVLTNVSQKLNPLEKSELIKLGFTFKTSNKK